MHIAPFDPVQDSFQRAQHILRRITIAAKQKFCILHEIRLDCRRFFGKIHQDTQGMPLQYPVKSKDLFIFRKKLHIAPDQQCILLPAQPGKLTIPGQDGLAVTRYGHIEFFSGLRKGNVYAFQCHPERSGPRGLQIYRNLATLAATSKEK